MRRARISIIALVAAFFFSAATNVDAQYETFSDQTMGVGGNFFDATTKFDSNANRPLGGLFAPDFTRTLSFFGGWNSIAGFAENPTSPGSLFDDDFAFGIAYGRRHSHFLRSEFSFTYRTNDLIPQAVPAIPGAASISGETEVYSIMKNFLIEVPGNRSRITPYAGVGIGFAYIRPSFESTIPLEAISNSAFAFQPIGGLSVNVNQKTEFFAEYRYFRTSEIEFQRASLPSSVNGNYDAHNLFVGLRFEF